MLCKRRSKPRSRWRNCYSSSDTIFDAVKPISRQKFKLRYLSTFSFLWSSQFARFRLRNLSPTTISTISGAEQMRHPSRPPHLSGRSTIYGPVRMGFHRWIGLTAVVVIAGFRIEVAAGVAGRLLFCHVTEYPLGGIGGVAVTGSFLSR